MSVSSYSIRKNTTSQFELDWLTLTKNQHKLQLRFEARFLEIGSEIQKTAQPLFSKHPKHKHTKNSGPIAN